ncbi:PhnE/PtxC family ABC transporter permease [Mycoplasma phocoenae]|uniref:ABC transporter permease subunit n=1 Tax=Mycoplasma phocoenae TaxID=754517 RepID=A0A858U1C2_9MOLU|nr:ABC transporter permease subunit [Mycoplasma phocoenae]QJG66914.1 ABC transporter permease subunit [Mycoplasma phocoenae]
MKKIELTLTKYWHNILYFFQPKFIDVNGQKVIKKFPFFSVISWIVSIILFIVLLAKLNPDFTNIKLFVKDLKEFFNVGVNAQIGSNSDITPLDTFVKSLSLLWKTIVYSVIGTIFGILISIPMALLSSKNFVKSPLIYMPTRAIMSIIRAVPPLIIAYIFYFVVSPGLAAAFAVAIFVASLMAKWLYEDLDTYDVSSFYGLQSIGNNKIISFKKAILPYLSRRIVSYGFYSFEMVVRFAAILSIVGISTIGQLMADEYAVPYNYSHLSIVIWVLVSFMIIIELFNWVIKKYILNHTPKHVIFASDCTYEEKLRQLKKQKPKTIYLKTFIGILILVLFIASTLFIDFELANEVKLNYFKTSVPKLFSPDWSLITNWSETGLSDNPIYLAFEALAISIISATIGLLFSLILGILASKRISGFVPSLFFKLLIIVLRAVPAFTFVLIFLKIQQNSIIWAGTLALGIHSIGMLGKLITESVDKIDNQIFDSLNSVGMTRWQKIKIGVLKEIMPQTLSNFLYRIEINFKSSVVIGAVGACPFGQQIIIYSSDTDNWNRLSSYLLVTIVILLIIEQLSNVLRNKILNGYFFDQNTWIKKMLLKNKFIHSLAISKVNKYNFRPEEKHSDIVITQFNKKMLLQHLNINKFDELMEQEWQYNELLLNNKNVRKQIKITKQSIKNELKTFKKSYCKKYNINTMFKKYQVFKKIAYLNRRNTSAINKFFEGQIIHA